MRTKLGETHSRGCGAVDPRISPVQRVPSYTPDGVVTSVGTPIVWIDANAVSMAFGVEQLTFSDRMGNSFIKQGDKAPWQMPNAFNGRNCWRMCGQTGTSSTSTAGVTNMRSNSSITIATNYTMFVVLRVHHPACGNYGTAAMIFRHSDLDGNPDNFYMFYDSNGAMGMTFRDVTGGNYAARTKAGEPVIFSSVAASTPTQKFYVNGTKGGIDGSSALTFTNPRYLYWTYSVAAYSYPCNNDLAEYIVYSSVLSDADRRAVESYLGRKYGVIVA